jgi:hypothetical protein
LTRRSYRNSSDDIGFGGTTYESEFQYKVVNGTLEVDAPSGISMILTACCNICLPSIAKLLGTTNNLFSIGILYFFALATTS